MLQVLTTHCRFLHSLEVIGKSLYLFGGRGATEVFNDLYTLKLEAEHEGEKKLKDCLQSRKSSKKYGKQDL